MTTLFEKIGGASAVDAAVDIFYRKVLSDDSVSSYFDDLDMDGQIAKQKAFLTVAFGGPNNYSGKDMREAHKHMSLTEAQFGAIANHLSTTLSELKVPQKLIDEVMAIAGSTHDDVLNL